MSVQESIERKLAAGLEPLHFEVQNESGRHNVPAGSETHFKVVVVSGAFEGRSLVQRHRMVYGLLAEEIGEGVHALALHTYTESDWVREHGAVPASPRCLGGKAIESAGR